jgi:hypothetical protein
MESVEKSVERVTEEILIVIRKVTEKVKKDPDQLYEWLETLKAYKEDLDVYVEEQN